MLFLLVRVFERLRSHVAPAEVMTLASSRYLRVALMLEGFYERDHQILCMHKMLRYLATCSIESDIVLAFDTQRCDKFIETCADEMTMPSRWRFSRLKSSAGLAW